MKFISGKKLSMTQIWVDDKVTAVTPVAAGPCTVSQVKTKAKDGYDALQLAYGSRKAKNIKKPQTGHFKASGSNPAYVKEFRTEAAADFKVGDVVSAGTFQVGDTVNVTGTSKGRGFQGVVKRHGFGGFRKTHGNKDQLRRSGSIGATGPAHVFKGTRMPGRMGDAKVTVTNLEIAGVDEANDILLIKGAIPGHINGYVMIQGQGDLQVNMKKEETASDNNVEKEEIKDSEDKPETQETKAEESKEKEEIKAEENEKKEDIKEDDKKEEAEKKEEVKDEEAKEEKPEAKEAK